MALWRARPARRDYKLRETISRPALVLAALMLWLGGSMPPASAQGLNPFGWFQQVFRPQRGYDEYAPPRPHPHYVYRPHTATTKTPAQPAVPPSFFVAVLGDSLGQLLGQGLTTALSDRPEVAVLRDAKEDSGLVRDDYYDWPKAAHDLVASGQKINVAVIMIGSNDHQTLHDANGSYDPGTPQYEQIYSARIEAVAKIFHDAKIPLLWVGLPIMKSDRFSTEMAALNDMYRQYASRDGATYLDIWDDFVDDSGAFSSYGPDVDGQVVRLRALDGIHFTKAGALKLASFVEPPIRDILNSAAPQDDAALAKIETTAPAGTNSPAGECGRRAGQTANRSGAAVDRAGPRPRRPARDADRQRSQDRYGESCRAGFRQRQIAAAEGRPCRRFRLAARRACQHAGGAAKARSGRAGRPDKCVGEDAGRSAHADEQAAPAPPATVR